MLNANYLLAPDAQGPRRASTCRSPSTAPASTSSCCPGARAKRELGVKTLDVAKRLLDYGFHPPTVYFPLLVDEALMVEPTETETKETLDAFAAAVEEILAEAEQDPEIAQNAPYTTPVRRLDEVGATQEARRAPGLLGVRGDGLMRDEDLEALRARLRGLEPGRSRRGARRWSTRRSSGGPARRRRSRASLVTGRDGFRAFIESWTESFDDLRIEPQRVRRGRRPRRGGRAPARARPRQRRGARRHDRARVDASATGRAVGVDRLPQPRRRARRRCGA